jgi:two-component system NarL family sensor kinase
MSNRSQTDDANELLVRRNRELSILNTIAGALNRETDLTRAVHVALVQVAELFDLHTGWVWLSEDKSGESYLASSHNLPAGLTDNPELMEGDCYCLRTYREGDLEGAANVNVVTCSRLSALVDGADGLRYHASIPLSTSSDRRLGMLNVASRDWRELSEEDLRILYTVGDLLGIAVERARLFERGIELGAVEERNRLAREIHDTLAQRLAAVALQLETAEAHLDAGSDAEQVRTTVHKALALTQGSLEEARRSVLDLRAAPLEGRTLAEALTTLAEQYSSDGDLKVSFESVGGARPLARSVESGLFRMGQEALTNVTKHSGAGQVLLRLVATPLEIELSVEDDGKGFEPSDVPGERYGLVGINERARLLGGTMSLESSSGVGTRISIRIPLETSGSNGDGSTS